MSNMQTAPYRFSVLSLRLQDSLLAWDGVSHSPQQPAPPSGPGGELGPCLDESPCGWSPRPWIIQVLPAKT